MTTPNGKLLQGTLDLLVMKTLAWGPRHGYAIARWLEETSREQLRIEEGSLYPALYRLEARGLVQASWGKSELGNRIKLYALTPLGSAELQRETERYRQFASAVARILRVA